VAVEGFEQRGEGAGDLVGLRKVSLAAFEGLLVNHGAGAHFIALDFVAIAPAGGDPARDGGSSTSRCRLGLQGCRKFRR
jgi:hypothetical protein